MSIASLIIGESGTGKTTALRNMNPATTLLIQSVKKPLPFRAKGWSYFDKEAHPEGNMFVCDNAEHIIALMTRTQRHIIVIDDFQYTMSNEFLRRSHEKGFDKFTEIGRNAWEIIMAANHLGTDKHIYFLSHSNTDDAGFTKMKTIGKLLDDKITVEGLFTIVLRTKVQDDAYWFTTRNSGNDTTKTPLGMFEDARIENDLAKVDARIVEFYSTDDISL